MHRQHTPPLPIPVSIITGFLGAGKTLLLSRLLVHPAASRSAVVINEVGEIPLDHLIVFSPVPDMHVLSGGCICCSSQGDFVTTFRTLLQSRADSVTPFERVIVETTGIADPVAIVRSIASDRTLTSRLRIDAVITVVDGINALSQLKFYEESARQIKLADLIIVSKVDIAEPCSLYELRSELKRMNPHAELIDSRNGNFDLLRLVDVQPMSTDGESRRINRWLGGNEDAQHGLGLKKRWYQRSGYRHSVRSRSCFYDSPVAPAAVAAWMTILSTFGGVKLLRVKALLNVSGDPVIVQGVQGVFFEPVILENWPTPDRRSQIVFIFEDLDESNLMRTLDAFELRLSRPSPPAVDPVVYGQFLNLVVPLKSGGTNTAVRF